MFEQKASPFDGKYPKKKSKSTRHTTGTLPTPVQVGQKNKQKSKTAPPDDVIDYWRLLTCGIDPAGLFDGWRSQWR